jgi:hypothetical protein
MALASGFSAPASAAARRQIGIGDLPRMRRIQVGQHRTKRIGCDRRDRAGLGAKAETMKGERRPLWIKGHDGRFLNFDSLNRAATSQ